MDAIELLTADHEEVRSMFAAFQEAQEAEDTGRMRELQEEIFSALETHTRIEEDVFYPAVRDLGDEQLAETVAEGIQEHHVVKVLMREIEDVSGDETFVAKMRVLIENVEHHAGEEEEELFPEVREKMGDERLQSLGRELGSAR